MRIFLDANILFSAARSNGVMRQLLAQLNAEGHLHVADTYVATEAQRNIAAKETPDAATYLAALLSRIVVASVQSRSAPGVDCNWLPEKDRPVLIAAIASKCDVLVTGDRTHFGAGYGKALGGVTILSPAQLAQFVWGPHHPGKLM